MKTTPVATQEEVLHVLREAMPSLREKYRVGTLSLFGSFARNEQSPESDVDLIVEYTRGPYLDNHLGLKEELAELLGRKADVVMRDGMKELIRARAESEEIPL